MSLVVGVIGHVDHGKTALTGALTGEETDRLPEEKARGISIALGFARLKADGQTIDLIDMPGHERFIRTMIAGVTGIDAVLLVLAANEGIKPQTIEHIDIAGLLGLRRAIIAISKTDLVTPEVARSVASDAAQLLAQAGFLPDPPVFTSVARNEGIEALRNALKTLAAGQPLRPANGLAFLPIDRAFSIAGHGPVVTGTLRGAAIRPGDTLELLPAGKTVRIRAIQLHGQAADAAAPGQRVALNLRDIDVAQLGRGMALAAPGTCPASDWLTMSIRAVAGAAPLKNGMQLRALIGTAECDARLRLLDRDSLGPGETGFAQLHFAAQVAFPAREHVILRNASPAQTVAGGRILEPVTRRRRRFAAPILQRLSALALLAPEALPAAEIEFAGAAGTTIAHLSRLSALAPAHVIALLSAQAVLLTPAGLAVRTADVEALAAKIPALVAPYAAGVTAAKLLEHLPGTGAAVLEEAAARLLASKILTRRGSHLALCRPAEDAARATDETIIAREIAAALRAAGLTPPDPQALISSLAAKRATDRLLREGSIIRAVDRAKNKELLFHEEAIEHAMRILAPLLDQPPGLLATDVCAALKISRKYGMPLLDHLDAIRFTRRINDRRIRGTAALLPPAQNV